MTEHERALSSSCLFIVTRTRTVAQVMSLSHHPHVHVHVSVSPRLALTFPFPALPAALLPLPLALEVRRLQPAAPSAQGGLGLVSRVPSLHNYCPLKKLMISLFNLFSSSAMKFLSLRFNNFTNFSKRLLS